MAGVAGLGRSATRRRRGGTGAGGDGGRGGEVAGDAGRGWSLGRRGVEPGVELDDARADAAARPRARSKISPGAARPGAGARARHLAGRPGLRGKSVLRRRGRAVHQRPGRRRGCLLRRRCLGHRRAPAHRATSRRGLELRGAAALHEVILQHDDLRAGSFARIRAHGRSATRRHRGTAARGGISPRTATVPSSLDGRGHCARSKRRSQLDAVRVSHVVALRRAPGAGIFSARLGPARSASAGSHGTGGVEAADRRNLGDRGALSRTNAPSSSTNPRALQAAGIRCGRCGCWLLPRMDAAEHEWRRCSRTSKLACGVR